MRFPLVAAVVLPALILLAAAMWLSAEPDRARTPAAAANDAALAKASPGIVIVGNSKAGSDLDPVRLARGLDYGRPIATVQVAGSSAPAWYAMLEQRVFAQGHRPELVVIYGQLSAMLRVEAVSEGERKGLEGQLDGPSAVLDAKVFGKGASAGLLPASFRRNATAAHDALLAGLRDYAVGAVLAPASPDGVRVAGKRVAEPALDALFGADAHFLEGGGARVVPVAERSFSAAMTASDVAPEASLLPDLVALAKEHDARVVFVRAPLPAASRYTDTLPPAVENAAFAEINALGASYLDLQAAGLPANAWRDHLHLSLAGQAAATNALVAAMAAAEILDGGVAAARPVRVPASVTRVGALPTPPALTFAAVKNAPCAFQAALPDLAFLSNDALQREGFGRASPLVLTDAAGVLSAGGAEPGFGDTCVGAWQHRKLGAFVSPRGAASTEGLALTFAPEPTVPDAKGAPVWWVYPGSAIAWHYTDAPSDAPVRVEVTARAAKGGGGHLRIGDVEVPLVADGRLFHAAIEVPTLPPDFTLTVAADPDTWLVIDALVLGDQVLLGEPPVTLTPLVRGPFRSLDPPPIQAGAVGTDGALATLALPGLAHIADDTLRARIDYPCSPVQVAPESAPDTWIREAHRLANMLQKAGGRGFGHLGEALLLAPPSEAMPAGPYRVRLDPKRKCGVSTWVYPGDDLHWRVVASSDRLRLGADRLVLEGISLLPADDARAVAPLRVTVRAIQGGEPPVSWADVNLPAQGGFSRACVPLDPPIPPATGMELTLSSDDPDAWFIVTNLRIGETEHLAAQDGQGCGA